MPRIASLANITSFTAKLKGKARAIYALTNSGANDPTSQQWRDNHAPASYQWHPNMGISVYEDDPITDMEFMFNQSTFNDPDITTWDTSTVTNFSGVFANTTAFNQDISGWDTSNVTQMTGIFAGSQAFNQDISSWDTSNVTQMLYMFSGSQAFNQDLSSWNTTSMAVDTIPTDFAGSSNFAERNWPLFGRDGSQLKYYPITNSGSTDPTNSVWRSNYAPSSATWIANRGYITDITDPITNMAAMFSANSTFNDPDVATWNTSGLNYTNSMFYSCSTFNQDIGGWDTSSVAEMSFMFRGATAFNQPIGNWNVSSCYTMKEMFYGCTAFNQDISSWDVSYVLNMASMFGAASSFNQDLTGWKVTRMALDVIPSGTWGTFNNNSALPDAKMPLFGRDGSQLKYYPMTNSGSTDPTGSSWRTNYAPSSATWIANRGYITTLADPITSMASMFYQKISMNDADLQYWDVSTVTSMDRMLYQTPFNHDISGWDVSNVTDMDFMFTTASSFNQPIGNWNVSNVTKMDQMFNGASSFNQDLSGWCVTNITGIPSYFKYNCPLSAANTPVWGTCP